MSRALTKGLMNWLLRSAMILNRRFRSPAAGFVLPTVILLLLVVSLTVGALVYRAYSRSAQVIGESQQRVIYNAATPAIDRARAKLETLFDATKDSRYPGGVPAENYMTGMLRNDGSYGVGALGGPDQYTIPGETRINLDATTKTGELTPQDNAWAFRTDTNGDGALDATVVYSIVLQTPPDQNGVAGSGMVNTSETVKANSLFVRQGPLSNQLRGNCAIAQDSAASSAAQGWFQDLSTSSTLRKNFQVDALVIPDTINTNGSFTTLEMQQDRKLDRGNKWGAWFRYDMEIFPGPTFNWNGAMHTEGSFMTKPQNGFNAFLVSSQASCLMSTASNSEITVTDIVNSNNDTSKPPDFVGLAFAGSIRDNDYNGSSSIHIWPATTNPAQPSQIATLENDADGGSAQNATGAAIPVALDPVRLLTDDVSQARGSDRTNRTNRKAGWRGLPNTGTPRIYNQAEAKPYVDDLYRADNRWGPKPRYNDQIAVAAPNRMGDVITSDVTTLVRGTVDPNNLSTVANAGLDGYWERRAFNEGLRVIVGQRLELGNAFGWVKTGPRDPLYPPSETLTHEQRQRRTLRDNIAAVQSTAIYHRDSAVGAALPVACLASTAHPGTATTLANSITFQSQPVNGTAEVITDFLTGKGTNGWEFAPPAYLQSEAAFAAAIAPTQPLGKALRNLAMFAGDDDPATPGVVDGAFPPRQEASGSIVHPYPLTSMWGNFSELRRALARLDAGIAYTNADPLLSLSIAEQSTLHTAACTLGMLAYNINGFTDDPTGYDYADNANNSGLSTLGGVLFNLVDGLQNNGEVKDPTTGAYFPFTVVNGNPSAAYYDPVTGAAAKYSELSADDFVKALLTDTNIGGNPDRRSLANIATIIYSKQQADRDRLFGFENGSPPAPTDRPDTWENNGKKFPVKVNNTDVLFPTGCDPETFPLNQGAPEAQARQKVGLALAFCENTPRYPALFYLFPKVDHDYDGDSSLGNQQPTNEQYSSDPYIQNKSSLGYQYRVVGITPDDFSEIAMTPRRSSTDNWRLPILQTRSNVTGANVSPNLIVDPTGALRAVGFLDRGVFNGREMMTTRTMDLDLGMLRSLGVATGRPWLPVSGIVYAFREDAVREDAIARPAGGLAPVTTNATTLTNPTDPTLATNANNVAISTKQVDFIADPDRRPHGFRLRNGVQIKRNDSFALPSTDNTRGLSFFTDSPVYIQGDFNLHKRGADDTPGTTVEEFTETLVPGNDTGGLYTVDQFYRRTNRSPDFARTSAGGDRWRPTEILADAVSILSDSFCDGSIEDAFIANSGSGGTITNAADRYNNLNTPANPGFGLFGPGCTSNRTSFLNQNRPTANLGAANWRREDGTSAATATTPIRIDRNGKPLKADGTVYTGNYDRFVDDKSLMPATNAGTTVDSIIVSGIVPSRAGQSYGGLHNFPRFLENWDQRNLWFAGSFLQLNFSNSATAPFDQDVWEPPLTASPNSEAIRYYSPPNRVWGYDPALQLAPAGPAAARFITAGKNRNEFYSELPANDPYIRRLCTAARTSGITGVPANINCPA
ncbi:hormogonium polysaccharide biosynthesis protein HpsA [Stenomitos frigidus AS-A4]|uniref:Hormogonium polysaccharide biosynthesis protein HpsA n=2 Tax=Cyanobacteriota TaxID=1117 RepID=A0ABV0KQB6_9CYAN